MTEIDEFVRLARSCREQELRVALSSAMAIVAEYETARSTISDQEKKIAELEMWLSQHKIALLDAFAQHDKTEAALTSEHQRREEAEAVGRPLKLAWESNADLDSGSKLRWLRESLDIYHFEDAAAYFRKYEPGK